MKRIFLKPIGQARELGRPSHWLRDALALFVIGLAILLALIDR